MIVRLTGYRDDKGRLEVEVELKSGVKRVFEVCEHESREGELAVTVMKPGERPSWDWRPVSTEVQQEKGSDDDRAP